VIEHALRTSPLRDAALGIVHGTQLVYARGYTLAEPDWPITQPTTFFRLASDSKTIAALAAYQVIERNPHFSLDTTMQSVLNLKTPSGQAPVDARFDQVTLRELLEHTSGLQPDDFSSGPNVVDAWKAAGHANVEMPVTRAQAESYIASEQLVYPPGMTQVYSNSGYFLIGRMLASLAGVPDALTACQQFVRAVADHPRAQLGFLS
jgi:CubicO group peptidase (beta-lactamase class C family)